MLSLGRKAGDVIRIGDEIVIRVLEVFDSSVRLGLEAPLHVHVVRAELVLRDSDQRRTKKEIDTIELEDGTGSRSVVVTYLPRKRTLPP